MIDAFQALVWLNAVNQSSKLSNETRRLLKAAAGFSPHDSRVRLILERLRSAALSMGDPLERAEIWLYCAAIGKWRGWFPQAARDATQAVLSYDNDDHRRAVALWILGLTQWEMLQNHDAYRNCADAKEIFKQRQVLFQHFPDEEVWYKNHIRQMEIALAARPEEIWTWLNCFERSSLGPRTQQVVECVQEKIRDRAYQNIYALMQDLQEANRRCEQVYERAEIYLEFGLAIYQMGNQHFAIELLRKAVQNFNPGIGSYHKQVVARCMLGSMEWMQESSCNQAAETWKRCIDQFEDLRCWAEKDNLQEKQDWYARHGEILRAALLERVAPPKQSDPFTNKPRESRAESSPSGHNWKKGCSYDDLLSKVGWDRATADRLIEYERKKSPATDRNELIRRANERWIRDNQ